LFDGGPPPVTWPLAVAEHVELVVFGAHLRGGPLVHQLTDRGACGNGDATHVEEVAEVRVRAQP
ncbi:allophanate hydrolase, partial [Mycobacterium sp. ITM-2017-0098]